MPKIDLEKEKIADGFKIPDDYFANLRVTVLQKISIEEKKKKRNRIVLFVSSVAACAVLLLSVILFTPNENSTLTLAKDNFANQVENEDQFSEIEAIEEIFFAYNEISEIHTQQIANDLNERAEYIGELIENDELHDVDYQILDYYTEDILSDFYY